MDWNCPLCTFANHYLIPRCEMCGSFNTAAVVDLTGEANEYDGSRVEGTTENTSDINYEPAVNGSACVSSATTGGIVDLLHNSLQQEGKNRNKADYSGYFLCSPHCVHITQRGNIGAHWSCGYRNLQMLCSSLLRIKEYREVLFDRDGVLPDVLQLQQWIEAAWRAGFDEQGAEHFAHKLAGKSSWIGTTECAALLRYFGIRAMIVDFPGDGANSLAERVTRWVGTYFESSYASLLGDGSVRSDAAAAGASGAPEVSVHPLYFQHEGHSRTIVGCEFTTADANAGSMAAMRSWLKNGNPQVVGESQISTKSASVDELYVFDPLSVGASIKQNLEVGNKTWRRQIKRGKHVLENKGAYQILYIAPGIMKPSDDALEYERAKVLRGLSDLDPLQFRL